jgi:hypothetical protein
VIRPAPYFPPLAAAALLGLAFSCSDRTAEPPPRVDLPALDASHAANFSGENAHRHVAEIVAFGPRPPASEGYGKTLQYLESTLAGFGWTTRRQEFRAATPDGPTSFTNLVARHADAPAHPASLPVVLGGHIDGKILPFEFVAANDGGSSTGILLEIARVLAAKPADAAAVELVFFDGEEAFRPKISPSDGLYGSKHFAHDLVTRPDQPALGIVIDLVGDRDVPLFHNPEAPPEILDAVGEIAADLDFPAGFRRAPIPILDDHVPLQNTGLPCLHLIGDFRAMPYWHQPGDTLDKVHPDMLENVGRLVLEVLARDGLLGSAAADDDH